MNDAQERDGRERVAGEPGSAPPHEPAPSDEPEVATSPTHGARTDDPPRPAEAAPPTSTRPGAPGAPGRVATAVDAPAQEAISEDRIVRARVERPEHGWRSVVYRLTGGRLNPGPGGRERARQGQLARIRRPLPATHHIAVSSIKGGVGKTTVASCLGLVLAEARGDRVVALDASPNAGTLADRLTGKPSATVRDLLAQIDNIHSLADVTRCTSLAGRLQVLASEQDPAMSHAFTREEYEQVCAVLGRYYDIVVTDSGTGLVHSAMQGTLATADSLVIVGAPSADGASRADKTLDWLIARGHGKLVADAVLALSCDRSTKHLDVERVRAHFEGRCRAVVEVPYDPHLASGALIELDRLRPATRDAFLTLAALLADRFPMAPAPRPEPVGTPR